jgi:hypothetical protein
MSIGLSNSRCGDTSGTRPATLEVGVDSARFLFRLHDESQQRAAQEMFGETPGKLSSGLRAGYMETWEALWVEGRPVQALMPKSTKLLPPSALGDAHSSVLRDLRDHGLTDARPAGVSRLDVTATVATDCAADGWALLRGMDLLDVPRRKSSLITKHGHPETVYKLTERGAVRERIYDKGLESGDAPPGRRIRFEAQTRHPKATRTTVEHWTMERIRETFETRYAPMVRSADGLHVASEKVIRQQIREHVQSGVITARQAELLLGHMAAESVGIPTPRRTRFRRRAELRRLGLAMALDGDDAESTDVDLPAVLEDVLTCAGWGA